MPTGVGIDLLKENTVVIDFTSLDHDSLFADLVTYAQTQFSDRWTSFADGEPAVMFTHLLAYLGDLLAYQQNALIQEMNPLLAVRRRNFIAAAKAFDFQLRGVQAASVDIDLTSDPGLLPYQLSPTALRVSNDAGEHIFMPAAETLVTSAVQSVPFVGGDIRANELLGIGTGRPDQTYRLASSPVLDLPNTTLSVTVNGIPWTRAYSPAAMRSTDTSYFVETDENNVTFCKFYGKNVPAGQEVRATYKIGGGLASNLASRSITRVLSGAPAALISLTNPRPASGGLDRQTLVSGKAALPASLAAQRRAVIPKDFEGIIFDNRLTDPPAPTGIAKASAERGKDREMLVWLAPSGGGSLTTSQRSVISAFYNAYKAGNQKIVVGDAVNVPVRIQIGAYIDRTFDPGPVLRMIRSAFVTEGRDVTGNGILDFDNVGFGGVDDTGVPQLSHTRIQSLLQRLQSHGLRKVVLERLTTIPVARVSPYRYNEGTGTITQITRTGLVSGQREWAVRWRSPTRFDVFRRIVGRSTFLSDTKLVDDRLALDDWEDLEIPLPASARINPNRRQPVSFAIDPATTRGTTVTRALAQTGSFFNLADTGDRYYLEIQDAANVDTGGEASFLYESANGVSFVVQAGTRPFVSGDELIFDVFPDVSDLVFGPNEIPYLRRDENGVAVDLTVVHRTAL